MNKFHGQFSCSTLAEGEGLQLAFCVGQLVVNMKCKSAQVFVAHSKNQKWACFGQVSGIDVKVFPILRMGLY